MKRMVPEDFNLVTALNVFNKCYVQEATYKISHFKISSPGELLSFLCENIDVTNARATELFNLGCIYLNNKRMSPSRGTELKKDDYLRVHADPRRFNPQLLDYPACLVFEHKDFIIINKPSGLPVPPTVDNAQENLVALLSNKRGELLHVTHRLDIPTAGLIFFARNKNSQRQFNELLINRKVKKLYRAIVPGTYLGETLLTHYMDPSPKAPKTVSKNPSIESQKCQLEILSNKSHFINNVKHTELTILLLTGRTHQIRAQLAHDGYPILGDHAYGSQIRLDVQHECISLKSFFLHFDWNGENMEFKLD